MSWQWDKQRRLYLDERGHRLPEREIREALDEYIASTQEDIARMAASYARGEITVTRLFTRLEEEVSALHGASGSIAYGGLEQMDLTKWERINERLQSELGYLAQFRMDVAQAANIVTPENPMSAEGIANRAGLYSEAAYSEYMTQVVNREQDNGVTLGRRICEKDGASCEECVDAATEEFIPLDEIADIGSLQCMNNCRCEIEFSLEGVEFRTSELFSGVITGQNQYGGSVEIN